MDHVLTLIANPAHKPLTSAIVAQAGDALKALGAECGAAQWLGDDEACEFSFDALSPQAAEAAAEKALGGDVDVIAQESQGRKKKLLIADMDSTIVTCETLDELADFAGLKDEIAALTERAMRGDMGFQEALKTRVGMLKGLKEELLQETLKRVELTQGAKTLIATMRANKAYCALISGGFDVFTDFIKDKVGFHCANGNGLIIENGELTGLVREPILGREAKLETLIKLAAKKKLAMSETLSVGDGANDAPMLGAAGLGIAFHGHQAAQDAASARLNVADLTGVLYAQGYVKADFCA